MKKKYAGFFEMGKEYLRVTYLYDENGDVLKKEIKDVTLNRIEAGGLIFSYHHIKKTKKRDVQIPAEGVLYLKGHSESCIYKYKLKNNGNTLVCYEKTKERKIRPVCKYTKQEDEFIFE